MTIDVAGLRRQYEAFMHHATAGSCLSTRSGWIWYCDVHDTHGNAATLDEAECVSESHYDYFCDSFQACEITVTRVEARGEPSWPQDQREVILTAASDVKTEISKLDGVPDHFLKQIIRDSLPAAYLLTPTGLDTASVIVKALYKASQQREETK